jgi:hypothetical protein
VEGSKKPPTTISKEASLVLHIGFPIIIFYLSFFLFTVLSLTEMPGYLIAKIHYHTLEHIIMSVTLLIIGAISIDLAKKSEK